MNNFWLSQSAVKDLERDEVCPAKWRGTWVTGEVISPSTEAMDNGSYGEYLCLGGGAPGRKTITDLPRLKSGDKSVTQIRIEEQAARFKELFDPNHPDFLGFVITNTQVELKHNGRSGVIDFDAVRVGILHPDENWIWDLKFTGDMARNWGDLYDKDFLQLAHYRDLYRDAYNILPHVGIIVLDFSPKKQIKVIELQISEQRKQEKEERFMAAERVITLYEERGWTKSPSTVECGTCPLECDKRIVTGQVVFEEIKY